jgi:hypothetical protein
MAGIFAARLHCAPSRPRLSVFPVASDSVLTVLQVGAERWSEALIPIGSMAFEIAGAGLVIALLLDAMRRTALVEASLNA